KFYGPGEELEGEGKDPLQLKHDPLRTGRPLGTGPRLGACKVPTLQSLKSRHISNTSDSL
ncbi:PGRMC2 isoform 8, partial [Pan troglodytes]